MQYDIGASDFVTGLMEMHEQTVWMLRAFLEGRGLQELRSPELTCLRRLTPCRRVQARKESTDVN
jgi:hypothetical protein